MRTPFEATQNGGGVQASKIKASISGQRGQYGDRRHRNRRGGRCHCSRRRFVTSSCVVKVLAVAVAIVKDVLPISPSSVRVAILVVVVVQSRNGFALFPLDVGDKSVT
jgi:hypothetical protein